MMESTARKFAQRFSSRSNRRMHVVQTKHRHYSVANDVDLPELLQDTPPGVVITTFDAGREVTCSPAAS